MALLSAAGQIRAILWAQWRAIANNWFGRNRNFATILMFIWFVVWYGMWSFGSFLVFQAAASDEPELRQTVARVLPVGLLAVLVYWQVVPLMLATSGLSLDMRRLLVYPVPHRSLFLTEAVLRVSTAPEMAMVTGALGAGLFVNPTLPWWTPMPLLPFVAFNLALSAGLRELFTRWMSRKGVRELVILALVLVVAAPQMLLFLNERHSLAQYAEGGFGQWWPWSTSATLAAGRVDLASLLALLAWTAAALWFGRTQFERSLRFDADAARARQRDPARAGIVDRIAGAAALFRDPIGALLEKEIRVLSRSPRFRLLFLMGFTFGLVIWAPFAFRREGAMQDNYLIFVTAYAIMLLGEVCFWNILGGDRKAVQIYFVTPVRMTEVLIAKNAAGTLFVLLEVLAVTAACAVLQFPVTLNQFVEALAVSAVIVLFLLSAGNLLSTRYPRAIDPAQSWGGSSIGRVQGYLLVIYPVVAIPVLLAYAARYAFDDSDLAFYGVLALDLFLGAIIYTVALESAAEFAVRGRERLLQALSGSEGPLRG